LTSDDVDEELEMNWASVVTDTMHRRLSWTTTIPFCCVWNKLKIRNYWNCIVSDIILSKLLNDKTIKFHSKAKNIVKSSF